MDRAGIGPRVKPIGDQAVRRHTADDSAERAGRNSALPWRASQYHDEMKSALRSPSDAARRQELPRCKWCLGSAQYMDYHDAEWGVPVHDERLLFEFLTLEGAQAGLSWSTILAKRDNYREAFAGFDPAKVARFTARDANRLMLNAGIVRNRLKIESTISNARAFLDVQKEFGSFDAYIWQFTGGKPLQNRWKTMGNVPASSAESDAMSRDLKKRGFRFVGSTICYAFMQAVGMVNDHITTCWRHAPLAKKR